MRIFADELAKDYDLIVRSLVKWQQIAIILKRFVPVPSPFCKFHLLKLF